MYINRVFPKTNNYLKEGPRIMLINMLILLIIGLISMFILWLVRKVQMFGFPLPLPVWLLLFATGIPYFVFWFQYGRAFGNHINTRPFIRGLGLGVLGNIPGLIIIYLIIKTSYIFINLEIYRITVIAYTMFLIMMPIMLVLGTLDVKDKCRSE